MGTINIITYSVQKTCLHIWGLHCIVVLWYKTSYPFKNLAIFNNWKMKNIMGAPHRAQDPDLMRISELHHRTLCLYMGNLKPWSRSDMTACCVLCWDQIDPDLTDPFLEPVWSAPELYGALAFVV